jgi:ketosteroid isomerase-like protein
MFERAFRSGFDANARGRTEETLPFFDPGVQLFITSENATVPPGTRRHYVGYDDFVAFFKVWSEVWKEWRLEIYELFDLGERLVITGTTIGLGRMSGIELRQQQAGIWTFADGQCVQVNLFWNHVEALEAAGLDAIAEEYRSRADTVG